MSNVLDLPAAFRGSGLRSTAQRHAVLNYLARRPVHATAAEICDAINRRDPRASRATVYNSLRALVEAGLVREISREGKAARFDAQLHRHHHFQCDGCGALEDVEWFELPPSVSRHAGASRRQIRTCEIVFRGTCARCAAPGER